MQVALKSSPGPGFARSLLTARDVLILKRLFDLLDIRGMPIRFRGESFATPVRAALYPALYPTQATGSWTTSSFSAS